MNAGGLLCPALVGRDAELARLFVAFSDPRSGHVIGLVGEAGVGKSALLRAAQRRASPATVVLEGHAVVNGRPFGPLADVAVAALVNGADVSDDSMHALGPGIAPLLVNSERTGDEGPVQPVLVAEALMTLITTMRVPTVLVLDDLHWADADTIEAIDRLASRASARQISIVLATRPASVAESVIARFADQRVADRVLLSRLDASAVEQMVTACLDGSPPPGLFESLELAAGHPFQIEELLRSAHDAGLLTKHDGTWSFDETAAVPIPPSITDAVVGRLRQLDAPISRIIAAAGVVGASINADQLARTLGVPLSAIDDAVRVGIEAQLLDPESTTIRFRHALSEEAAAAYLLPRERMSIAAATLAVVGATGGGDSSGAPIEPSAIARIARIAEDFPAAVHWHIAASDRLSSVAAVGAALAQLDLAQELESQLDAAVIAELRVRRVELLALVGRVEDAQREAAVALAAGGDGPSRGRLLIAAARAATTAAHHTAATGFIAEAMQATAHTDLFARASATAALLAVDRGDDEAATRHAEEALAATEDDIPARCQALEVLGRLARGRDLGEAASCFEREAALAEAHGLAFWRARGLHERATIDQVRSLAVDGLWTARAAAIDAGAPGLISSIEYHLSAVLTTRFEPHPALEIARNGVHLTRMLSNDALESRWWILVAYAHTVATPDTPQSADAALGEARRLGGQFIEVRALATVISDGLRPLLLGDVAAATAGYHAAATELIDNRAGVAPLPPWYFAPILATRADTDADAILDVARHPGLESSAAVRPNRLLAEAIIAGRCGDAARADKLAKEADTYIETGGAAGLVHVGRWLVAQEAHTADWGQPVEWLRSSEQWAADHGYSAIVDSCRAQLRDLGVTPKRRRSDTPVPDSLARMGVTGREIDVLALLGDGLTNKDIAERLHVSPRTVKGHVAQLLAKTASPNRSALAALATQHGL